MAIVPQTLHQYKDGDTTVAAQVDIDVLVIGKTRNEEHAAEGRFNLVTVIPLQEAIAIAKAVMALQQQAEEDAWIEQMYQRHLDQQALTDSALEHEIHF